MSRVCLDLSITCSWWLTPLFTYLRCSVSSIFLRLTGCSSAGDTAASGGAASCTGVARDALPRPPPLFFPFLPPVDAVAAADSSSRVGSGDAAGWGSATEPGSGPAATAVGEEPMPMHAASSTFDRPVLKACSSCGHFRRSASLVQRERKSSLLPLHRGRRRGGQYGHKVMYTLGIIESSLLPLHCGR